MVPCLILVSYLWIPVPETMAFNVKQVASCLWSSIEQFALPLDAAKCVEVTMWSADEIASDDCIQLGCCPQAAPLRRDQQLITQVGPDQLRQLGWKPSQNRVCSAVCVGNIVLPWGTNIVLDHSVAQGRRNYVIRVVFRVENLACFNRCISMSCLPRLPRPTAFH